jgi:hypothetical protein
MTNTSIIETIKTKLEANLSNLNYEFESDQLLEKYLIRSLDKNPFNITIAMKKAKDDGYKKIYLFADIHATILKPDYNNVAKEYYPMAKEVLQVLSRREDVCINLYTCSYPREIQEYLDFFKEDGIEFVYTNKNPEAENTKHGYFEDKPYMNILFEDKAGFDAEIDWYIVKDAFDKAPSLIK